MEYIYNLGGKIVGAVDNNKEIIGKDIGRIIGCDPTGIIIQDVKNLDELLSISKPDIAVITTLSFLNDIEAEIRTCIRNKVNVITTSEECFYPENSNPTLYQELDTLARAYNVTVCGAGYQDVFWGNMITVMASSTHKITKIKGSSSYNVEDYGIALAKAHGAGLSLEEFKKTISDADNMSDEERNNLIMKQEFNPSYMWNTVGWLAKKLGLTPIKMQSKSEPTTNESDLYSKTLDMNIKAGMATGMRAIAILETKEGITIEAECIGKVYSSNDSDANTWTIFGEPDTTVIINRPDTVRLTCADIVNRIPDVIEAKPGFIPTCDIGEATYKISY